MNRVQIGAVELDRILDELGNFVWGKAIVPGRTLVIFDEIQACGRAVTSLKYFCENKRELHVACAGSMLGVAVKREKTLSGSKENPK